MSIPHPLDATAAQTQVLSRGAAAGLGGIAAGLLYLVVQMTFSSVLTDAGILAPLHRIAAMLLGRDEVGPLSQAGASTIAMALLIHAGLSFVFGRLIGWAIGGRGVAASVAIGMALGPALFVINFLVIAPSAFPWFEQSPQVATAFDHLLFGGIAAAIAVLLSRPVTRPQRRPWR
jgi:hypothetical protein